MLHQSCEDNGAGIAPELMPEIFDLFSQGSRTVDRARAGSGLGLALVKHLVELHGGSVDAASDGAGRGATFTVCLPRDCRAARRRRRCAAAAHAAGAAARAAADAGRRQRRRRAQPGRAARDGRPRACRSRTTAPAALAQARRRGRSTPSCSTSGCPGMDGFELARELRARPQARRAPADRHHRLRPGGRPGRSARPASTSTWSSRSIPRRCARRSSVEEASWGARRRRPPAVDSRCPACASSQACCLLAVGFDNGTTTTIRRTP